MSDDDLISGEDAVEAMLRYHRKADAFAGGNGDTDSAEQLIRTWQHDAACWQRLRAELAFSATGPLPHESAIVERHMWLAEEHVKRQETAG